jgi:scytalone dehydratase
MQREVLILIASDLQFLGNPLLNTYHFVGLSTWQKISPDEILETHPLREPYQWYTDINLKEVAVKGHAHGIDVVQVRGGRMGLCRGVRADPMSRF